MACSLTIIWWSALGQAELLRGLNKPSIIWKPMQRQTTSLVSRCLLSNHWSVIIPVSYDHQKSAHGSLVGNILEKCTKAKGKTLSIRYFGNSRACLMIYENEYEACTSICRCLTYCGVKGRRRLMTWYCNKITVPCRLIPPSSATVYMHRDQSVPTRAVTTAIFDADRCRLPELGEPGAWVPGTPDCLHRKYARYGRTAV